MSPQKLGSKRRFPSFFFFGNYKYRLSYSFLAAHHEPDNHGTQREVRRRRLFGRTARRTARGGRRCRAHNVHSTRGGRQRRGTRGVRARLGVGGVGGVDCRDSLARSRGQQGSSRNTLARRLVGCHRRRRRLDAVAAYALHIVDNVASSSA